MGFIKTFSYFSILVLFLYSCINNSKIKNEKSLDNKSNLYLKLSLDKDTENADILSGKIKYYFKLEDSLKVVDKDKRYIYTVLTIEPHKENKTEVKKESFFEKELEFSNIKTKDTIEIPFKIEKKFKGEATVFGGINDNYILNSYPSNKDKIRMITYEHTFKEDIIIK